LSFIFHLPPGSSFPSSAPFPTFLDLFPHLDLVRVFSQSAFFSQHHFRKWGFWFWQMKECSNPRRRCNKESAISNRSSENFLS
jgi:hypothetical protein